MRCLSTIISLVLFLCLTATIRTSAQTESYFFINESDIEIDTEVVEAAARPLIDGHGAKVAIYVVPNGGENDLTGRLDDDNLNDFLGIRIDTLAIYIAIEDQYSEIRWGSDFDKLEDSTIRSDILNPALREGHYTQGILDTLEAIDRRLSNPLIGVQRMIISVCSSPIAWLIALFSVYIIVAVKMGWVKGSGSDYGEGGWDGDNGSSGQWGGGHSDGGSDSGGWSD